MHLKGRYGLPGLDPLPCVGGFAHWPVGAACDQSASVNQASVGLHVAGAFRGQHGGDGGGDHAGHPDQRRDISGYAEFGKPWQVRGMDELTVCDLESFRVVTGAADSFNRIERVPDGCIPSTVDLLLVDTVRVIDDAPCKALLRIEAQQ